MSDSRKGAAPAPAKYSDMVADGGMDPRTGHVEQQLRSTSPANWQSVPVNPTIEMIAALGFNGDVALAVGHANACEELTTQYRAMLACAPAAPLAKRPTAYLRASDLERLAPNNVAGCAASLSKEPGNGLVAIFTEAICTSAQAEALAAFVALAEERERELGDLSSEMRECLLKGRAALQDISPAPAWKVFDYNVPPASGMYWVAGTRPVWDVCTGDDGTPVGTHTGEQEHFVALVWFQIWTDDDGSQVLDFAAVDPYNLGKFAEDDAVSHFMPHVIPAHPAAATPNKEML